jgi:hypothetical protein
MVIIDRGMSPLFSRRNMMKMGKPQHPFMQEIAEIHEKYGLVRWPLHYLFLKASVGCQGIFE